MISYAAGLYGTQGLTPVHNVITTERYKGLYLTRDNAVMTSCRYHVVSSMA